MKRIIPLMMVLSLMMMQGCKWGANNGEANATAGQNGRVYQDGVLSDEEIEQVISTFSVYLRDSIDQEHLQDIFSTMDILAESAGASMEENEEYYVTNIGKIDSLMRAGIRYAKANDYDSLLALTEGLDMMDFFAHPTLNAETEYDLIQTVYMLFKKKYTFATLAPKLLRFMEDMKFKYDLRAAIDDEWKVCEMRAGLLKDLSALYAQVGRYDDAIATCKEYVEQMEVLYPDDRSALEYLVEILKEATIAEQDTEPRNYFVH